MLFLLLSIVSFPQPAQGQLQLPTPKAAYENYNPQAEALQLVSEFSQELDPVTSLKAVKIFTALQSGDFDVVSSEEIRDLLESVGWEKRRARILRLMIYQAGVLDLFSGGSESWMRFVHDFLLFFLDRLPRDRLIERLAAQLLIPGDDRGRRLIALADRTPSLQKIGQIMARYPAVPDDLRTALQTFENSVRSSRRDDVVDFIRSDVSPDVLSRYQMEFDDEILAEASVGAVIKVRLKFPQESAIRTVVCKVLKPYAVSALRDELVILGDLVRFFEEHGEFYQLGQIPLSQMFEEARTVLSKEIQVLEEQKNLARAGVYFHNEPKVKVPQLYSISTPNVTFMEFIEGGKIVDFPGDERGRARLAALLDEIMTWDVIFSKQDEAIFHGDPHAGNVFYLDDAPGRIALLDWGLAGSLPRRQRQQMIQLLLGIYLRNKKRVRNNVACLLEGGFQDSSREKSAIQQIAIDVMESSKGQKKDQFLVLNDMVVKLTTAGYSLNLNLVLFIKAQVTIIGILKELDPDLKRGKRAVSIVRGKVLKESPKRLLNTFYFPGWTSNNYPSMVSNEDIRDIEFKLIGAGFKSLGKSIWKGISYPFRAPTSGEGQQREGSNSSRLRNSREIDKPSLVQRAAPTVSRLSPVH